MANTVRMNHLVIIVATRDSRLEVRLSVVRSRSASTREIPSTEVIHAHK
jgi:hypothetical protein